MFYTPYAPCPSPTPTDPSTTPPPPPCSTPHTTPAAPPPARTAPRSPGPATAPPSRVAIASLEPTTTAEAMHATPIVAARTRGMHVPHAAGAARRHPAGNTACSCPWRPASRGSPRPPRVRWGRRSARRSSARTTWIIPPTPRHAPDDGGRAGGVQARLAPHAPAGCRADGPAAAMARGGAAPDGGQNPCNVRRRRPPPEAASAGAHRRSRRAAGWSEEPAHRALLFAGDRLGGDHRPPVGQAPSTSIGDTLGRPYRPRGHWRLRQRRRGQIFRSRTNSSHGETPGHPGITNDGDIRKSRRLREARTVRR
jgi:hypothetical protein